MKVLDNIERLAEVFDENKIAIIDDVVVFNHNLVHPAMLDVFEWMLKVERNHDLKAIFICPDGPLGERLAEYCKYSRSFILSLPKILEYTLQTEAEKQGMSLTAGIWTNMIYVFLHELRHNTARATDLINEYKGNDKYIIDQITPEGLEALEQDADEYATIMLEQLAAEKRIEMPPLGEIPWFNTRVMKLLIDEITAGEKEWAGAHKRLIDEELVFENENDSYTSIYDYFKDTTEQPELYGDAVQTTKLQMSEASRLGSSSVVEEKEVKPTTNVFDEQVLPGEQMDMFKQNFPTFAGMADAEKTKAEAVAPAKEVHVEASLEELEMLDSVGMTEPGEDDYGDVICEEEVGQAPASAPTPAPAAPAPQAAPVAPVVPATASNTALAMCMDVYARLIAHMFTVCGHRPDGTFTNPGGAIITPMPLSGVEIESGLFSSCYTVDVTNMTAVWDDCRRSGGIRARTFKNGGLPGYDLMINWFGKIRRVRLVAQNPNKSTTPAAKARAGAKIVWLIDQDDDTGHPFVGSWENGVYTPCKR